MYVYIYFFLFLDTFTFLIKIWDRAQDDPDDRFAANSITIRIRQYKKMNTNSIVYYIWHDSPWTVRRCALTSKLPTYVFTYVFWDFICISPFTSLTFPTSLIYFRSLSFSPSFADRQTLNNLPLLLMSQLLL